MRKGRGVALGTGPGGIPERERGRRGVGRGRGRERERARKRERERAFVCVCEGERAFETEIPLNLSCQDVGFICPFVVIDATNLGATTTVARNLLQD